MRSSAVLIGLFGQADGYIIPSAIKHIPIAGRDLTSFVQQLQRERETTIPSGDAMDVAKRSKVLPRALIA